MLTINIHFPKLQTVHICSVAKAVALSVTMHLVGAGRPVRQLRIT